MVIIEIPTNMVITIPNNTISKIILIKDNNNNLVMGMETKINNNFNNNNIINNNKIFVNPLCNLNNNHNFNLLFKNIKKKIIKKTKANSQILNQIMMSIKEFQKFLKMRILQSQKEELKMNLTIYLLFKNSKNKKKFKKVPELKMMIQMILQVTIYRILMNWKGNKKDKEKKKKKKEEIKKLG